MTAALLLLACAHGPALPWPEPPPENPPAPPPPEAGLVAGGVFSDAAWPFLLEVPEGWRAWAGPDRAGELRVVLEHPESGLRVEVRARPGAPARPAPRPGCTWDFAAVGAFRAVPVPEDVLVATCTPADPLAPRVLAVVLERDGVTWELDTVTPEDRLDEALRLGAEVFAGARWGR